MTGDALFYREIGLVRGIIEESSSKAVKRK
jgi:hypothetical protein